MLDVVVLIAFFWVKGSADAPTLYVSAVAIVADEKLFMRSHTDPGKSSFSLATSPKVSTPDSSVHYNSIGSSVGRAAKAYALTQSRSLFLRVEEQHRRPRS